MDRAARPPARPVRPPKGLRTPGMTTLGGGGLKFFEFFINFYKFFLETFQFPRLHGRAVVHDGSSVGAGGLEHDRATNQRT
jgi:uncharacterized SAM-binding protein YcdF (DUF218 family)